LPDIEAAATADGLNDSEAVRLFCDRARLAMAGFRLGAEHGRAVADICWRLDGIPLAIELAAARVKVLSPPEIAARLDDRFRLLTGGPRTALERHRTLRAAVDWSYEALSEAEQRLLARLSVFAGGFTLDATEAICATDALDDPVTVGEVLDLLTMLVDKSLVTTQAGPEHTRYRLLETIRQYAQDKLADSGRGRELRARHRDVYLALARRADVETLGPRGGNWLGVLEADHDNLLAALEWSLAEPDTGNGLRLAAALGSFWWRRGYLSEGRRYLARALETPGPVSGTRAWASYMSGVLAAVQGDLGPARSGCTEALAGFRALGDDGRRAQVLNTLCEHRTPIGPTRGSPGQRNRSGRPRSEERHRRLSPPGAHRRRLLRPRRG
jgi:non-specific serine/threonine protein kinase